MPKKLTIKKSALTPTILISGGAGFIGSHLAEALLSNKARVVVVDNFNTGKEIHVNHLIKNPGFALYHADINQGLPEEIETVDYIFHLASLEEYLYSKDLVNLDTLLTNSIGTKNLLDLAQRSEAKFMLVSTVDVYQGRMSQLSIQDYFGKQPKEENLFSLTEAKRFAEAVVSEYQKKYDLDLRIVRLPEVFGPRMNLEASGSLGGYIKDIIEHRNIVLEGDGLEKEYYLYVSDAVNGLIKAMFSDNTKNSIYSLVPDAGVSRLELAYSLKSLADGNIEVLHQEESYILTPPLTIDTFTLKEIKWEAKTSIKEGLVSTLQYFGYTPNLHSFKPARLISEKNRETTEKNMVSTLMDLPPVSQVSLVSGRPVEIVNSVPFLAKKVFLPSFPHLSIRLPKLPPWVTHPLIVWALPVVVSALVIFVLFPLGSFYFHVTRGLTSMEKINKYVYTLDSKNIEHESGDAYNSFVAAKKSFGQLRIFFKLTGNSRIYNTVYRSLNSLSYFSATGKNLASAVVPFESLWEVIRPDTQEELDLQKFEQAKVNLEFARNSLSLAQAEYTQVDQSLIPNKYKAQASDYQKALDLVKENLDLGITSLTEIPRLLGAEGERHYIVWLQNSNELRPTGGFIGSYGILRFEKGKMQDLIIDDIYNPDGQIDVRNIKVPAFPVIKTYLNEDQMYLRNSNWDPDFTKSAQEFGDLYFKVTGERVDGFIAIDLHFVEGLLRATGPVFLAAYNEEINATNLYERAQLHSDYNYKEGSDQKRSFLTVLGSKLLERLFALNRSNMPVLFTQVNDSIKSRHFLMYLENSSLSTYLTEKKWDGSLVSTTGDYLNIVNANLGGTKSNYFVKNDYSYQVNSMTRDGLLRGVLTLNYDHTALSDAWPGGPYTNYVRVLTQKGSKLTGAALVYPDGTKKDIFKDMVITTSGKYQSFETGFKLSSATKISLILSYDLPTNLSITKEQKNYTFYWQKQPGTHDDTFSYTFDPTFGMEVSSKSSSFVTEGRVLKQTGVLNQDLNLFVTLQ